MAKKRKKIGIDARLYGPVGKGLGRYTQEIVDNVTEMDRDNDYVVFLGEENYDEFKPRGANVKKVLAKARWYTLREQISMPFLIMRARVNMMHFPHFNVPILTPVKFTVTIHDLILTKYPTVRASTLSPFLYKIKNFVYAIVIRMAVMRAKRIITVSRFTKNDILGKFKISSDKVIVIYEGVADLGQGGNRKGDDRKVLKRYNIDKDYLLYVGNAYPHKNLGIMIKVFKILRDDHPGLRLVFVGKEDHFYKRLKEKAHEEGVYDPKDSRAPFIFAGYVPDDDLAILYRNAVSYIFPSLYEGFGLPPLEAISNGCPVMSSKEASMPEILGDAAVYFDPKDENDIADKVKKIIGDEDLRRDISERGEELIKKYDWRDCARETLVIYKKICKI